MKKLRNNKGITLPFAVLIVFLVTLLVAAVVGLVSLSVKLNLSILKETEHKLILENEMYKYLNDVSIEGENLVFPDIDSYVLQKTLVDGKYVIDFYSEKYQNIKLKITVEFNGNVYTITKWGFYS